MTQKPGTKGRAIALFLLVLVFWLGTVTHHTLGFIPPVNGEAIGFDFFTSFMWVLFAFVTWRLFSAFRRGE
jgi:hypothetical protein